MKGILSWAWNVKGLQPAPRIVLMAIASRADNDTFDCWPSRKLLADDCNMSVASLKRHVAYLSKIGVLEVEKRLRPNGSKTSNRYILKAGIEYSNAYNGRVKMEPEAAENMTAQFEPTTVQSGPRGGFKNDPSITLTDLTSSEAKASSHTARKKKVSLKPEGLSDDIWKDWKSVRRKPVTATVLSRVQLEADKLGWTIVQAITESAANSWQGFRADWVRQQGKQNGRNNGKSRTGSGDGLFDAAARQLTDSAIGGDGLELLPYHERT